MWKFEAMVGHLDRAQNGLPLKCNGGTTCKRFEIKSCISGKMKRGPSKASEDEPAQERAVSYKTIKKWRTDLDRLTATESQKAERKQ